jgi:pSer/pThr/pTyr-binding forkhead associated (FHA) protein
VTGHVRRVTTEQRLGLSEDNNRRASEIARLPKVAKGRLEVSVMQCPVCGETNEEGFRFCRNCGRALSVADDAAPTTSIPAASAAILPTPVVPVPTAVAPSAPPAAPTYRLIATAGLLSGRTFTIGSQGLLIGRDPGTCQVVVADDEISRAHAWIGFADQDRVVIRDRNSANGSYVNHVRIEERVLRPTDEISLGSGLRQLFRIERVTPRAADDTSTERVKPPKEGGVAGGTSALSPVDLTTAPEDKEAASRTVAIKLTDLMARSHVELIVDKYAVRSLDIPDAGLAVGRDSNRCQLHIDHPSISAVHAEFALRGGRVLLNDRSTNGTYVNGRREATVDLHDGDYITFGRYAGKSLIFRSGLEPELKLEKVDLDKDRITIGRDPSNDVVIDHPVVSKKHAEIIRQEGKVFLVDLGSTNGTFVNGIKVKRHRLQRLDRRWTRLTRAPPVLTP